MKKTLLSQLDELDEKVQLQGIDYPALSALLREIIQRIEPSVERAITDAQREALLRQMSSKSLQEQINEACQDEARRRGQAIY